MKALQDAPIPSDVRQDELIRVITATINGMSDFRNIEETLTLAVGATATNSVNSYTSIDKISLSAVASHDITVKTNGAAIDEVQVAKFVKASSEQEAMTSAYGLFNPGSKVKIDSTSGTDGTDRKVTVTGYGPMMSGSTVLEDNIYQEVTLTSNGASEVTSAERFTNIESVSLDAEAVGIFSVKSDPTQTRRIATLPQKKRSLDIPIVGFYPIPDGKIINYQYYRTLTSLTIDSDRPPMDQRVHNYIRKWAETAVNQWYGDSSGVSETIQNALPSWRQDIQSIRNTLGLSANPQMVIGGRARNIGRKYGPTAMLDPAYYSN